MYNHFFLFWFPAFFFKSHSRQIHKGDMMRECNRGPLTYFSHCLKAVFFMYAIEVVSLNNTTWKSCLPLFINLKITQNGTIYGQTILFRSLFDTICETCDISVNIKIYKIFKYLKLQGCSYSAQGCCCHFFINASCLFQNLMKKKEYNLKFSNVI